MKRNKKLQSVIENESTIENQSRVFADAIKLVDIPSPLAMVLVRHFTDEMTKAANEGRICTPERMVKLYPIFREINIEMEEIKAENAEFEREAQERETKKQAKKNKSGGNK